MLSSEHIVQPRSLFINWNKKQETEEEKHPSTNSPIKKSKLDHIFLFL